MTAGQRPEVGPIVQLGLEPDRLGHGGHFLTCGCCDHQFRHLHRHRRLLAGGGNGAVDLGFGNVRPGPEFHAHHVAPDHASLDKIAECLRLDPGLAQFGDKDIGRQVGARGEFFHSGLHLRRCCGKPKLFRRRQPQPVFDQVLQRDFLGGTGRAQQLHEPHPLRQLEFGDSPVVDVDPGRKRIALRQGRASLSEHHQAGGNHGCKAHHLGHSHFRVIRARIHDHGQSSGVIADRSAPGRTRCRCQNPKD